MRCDEGFHLGYFGDARRQRAGATLYERVVETGSLVLRQVGSDRRGEMSAQRFLASEDVTHQEILITAGRRTASACAGRRIVAAQDTTEINFKDRDRAREGLGPAGDGQTPAFSAMRWWRSTPRTRPCWVWCTHTSGPDRPSR